MRILLVDDNRLMLEGLQNLLEAHDIEVVGMASDGLEAVGLARERNPDVILMDIRMPRCNGLEATRLIKAEMPEAVIIMLTTSTEDDDLFEAIKSGACGYLLKSMDTDELVAALDQARQGTPPFSPGLAAKLLDEFARIGNPEGAASSQHPAGAYEEACWGVLKPRQIEVLRLLAEEGKIILYSSHILEVVEKICSRAIIIHKGRIVADDSVENLRSLMKLPSLEEIFSQLVVQEDTAAQAQGILSAIRTD